jgi:hypothetical protein
VKRYKTEIQTPGPAAQLAIEPAHTLGRFLERAGIEGSIILSRKDGKELSEEELIRVEAFILALLGE